MFADSGIPMMFHEAYEMGAQKRRLRVRVAGGAQIMDESGVFNIGKRNCLAMRKIFWKAGVMVQAEETGGGIARTMRFDLASGRIFLRSPGGTGRKGIIGSSYGISTLGSWTIPRRCASLSFG